MVEEKEISLSTILYVVWDRGKMILLFTGVAMVLTYLISFSTPNRYKAAAMLIMNKSKIGTRTMLNPAIPMKTFDELYNSKKILKEVMDNHKEFKKYPYNFKHLSDLEERVDAHEVWGSSLIRIEVTLEDPVLAADVANELATKAIKINDNLIRFEKEASKRRYATELEFIQLQTDDFQKDYLELLTKNLKPTLIAKLGNKTSILLTLEQEKETLDHSIIELQERELRFKSVLAGTDFTPIITIERKVVVSPIMADVVNSQVNEPLDYKELQDLTFLEQTINPDYSTLYAEYKKLQVDLPAMQKKRDSYHERIEVIDNEIETMQKRLSEIDLEEMVAKANFDRSLEILSGIDKEEGWAGTTVTSERQDLYLIDEAIPDNKKVYPKRTLTAALGGMIVFLLSFLYYLLVDLYGLLAGFKTKRDDEPAEETRSA